jgi:hypothetical protein
MRSLAFPPVQKIFAPLWLYWQRSPFTYVLYQNTTFSCQRSGK